jgi:ketosteroid isomerase-like protein
MSQTEAQARHPHLLLIRSYFDAIERQADEAELSCFFAAHVRQHEFPNRVVERGAERGLAQLLAGSREGRAVVEDQRYEVRGALVDGERVAIELTWTARLKVPLASTKAGGTLTANCGVFFRIADGRIVEQHNYDCFDAF